MAPHQRSRERDELPVVLCVSEDKSFLNTMRLSLGHAGFIAVATSSAAEALELAGRSQLDAMICDYNMSRTDGITLFEQIQDLLGENTPPTLIAGDHYAAPLLARCLKAGTAGLHSKSDPAETLVERMISIIRDESKRAKVERSATTRVMQGGVDLLTRIASKEHFTRRLSAESVASYRDGSDLSLLVFEIDRYAQLAERYGRQQAEKLLAQVALLVEGELRSRDCVARFSEYSFGVILPESGADAAAAVGRRLRTTMAASEFGDLDHPIAVTISVGAACRRSGMRAAPNELVSLAQRNCMAASQMGGDRLVADALLTGKPLALVVGPTGDIVNALVTDLESCNVEARQVQEIEQAMSMLESLPAALIVLIYPPPFGSKDILVWARDRQPAARRVLVAEAAGDQELLMYAVNEASVHYILGCPWRGAHIVEMVDRLVYG